MHTQNAEEITWQRTSDMPAKYLRILGDILQTIICHQSLTTCILVT